MKSELNRTTALGLDVGTSRIVLARSAGDGYRFESQLNAFVSVPYSKMTELALERERIPFSARGGEIVVHGNEAERFADMLSVETRRPMTRGILNPEEADGLAVIRGIVESLAGDSGKGPDRICFTVPAPPLGSDEHLTYHEAALRQLLSEMGYRATGINEGLAVIYSELEDTNFTGIGISCGGGLCNVSVAYLSMPAMSFSIPKAGDFIDASAASVTGDLANRIRIAKETSFHLNGKIPDKLHQVLTVYYEDVMRTLVDSLKECLNGNRRIPRFGKAIPLVLSGGTALPEGFRDRFEKILLDSDFPMAISEVRLAKDPLNATARGALIAALVEMDAYPAANTSIASA
jgi:hypothetical protein